MMTSVSTRYLRNPDVVLREEDPDEGGLLFNPDTNQVKVMNATALSIWQHCYKICTLDDIIAEIQKEFEDVPQEQVAQDVRDYLENMLASGFIGILETTG